MHMQLWASRKGLRTHELTGNAHGPAAVAMRLAPPPGWWMQAPARGVPSATALTPAMYTLNEDGMLPGTFSSITPVV